MFERVSGLLEPWAGALGADLQCYRNHALRVLNLCDRLAEFLPFAEAPPPSDRTEFVAAAVFHDLGIWSAGTFDYLHPSVQLARSWLTEHGRGDLVPVVSQMIEQHHKLTPAADPQSPVEMFRRADTIDVLLGARRFGVAWSDYRAILRSYPDLGFHLRLLVLTAQRARTHPLSPLPMFKW